MAKLCYLAVPLDLYTARGYDRVVSHVRRKYPAPEWTLFEPARAGWNAKEWLRQWPRLLPNVGALVIWPRPDRSIGRGVHRESTDVQATRPGDPVMIVNTRGQWRRLRGLELIQGGENWHYYARVIPEEEG